MPLVTVDECAQWLGVDLSGDARSTALLTQFVAAASTKVESWCRQFFGANATIDQHRLTGCNNIFYLSRTPVSDMTQVIVEDVDAVQTELLTTDYTWDGISGRVKLLGTYATFVGTASVSYIGGVAGAVPDQVQEATIHIVSMLWYAKGRDTAASTQSAGQFSKTLSVDSVSGLPVSAETLLLDYRRVLGELV